MLKSIGIFTALAYFIITFPVFAQDTSQENQTYVQKAQQMLNNSTAQAKKQFDKSYPTPTAPKIQTSPMTSAPKVPPPKVIPQKTVPSETTDNDKNAVSTLYDQKTSPQTVTTPPVFTTPGTQSNLQKNASQPAQNIFIPPNNTATHTGDASAPNPYR